MTQAYYRYWGKAKPTDEQLNYHLLAFHSLDVAAMGKVVLEQNLFNTDAMIASLNCDKSEFIDFFSYLLALHDIGKFASAFQNLARFDTDELVNTNSAFGYAVKHDSLGFALWRHFEEKNHTQFEHCFEHYDNNHLDILMQVVTGHHGKPPIIDDKTGRVTNYFTDSDLQAAWQFIEDCRFLLPATPPAIAFEPDLYEALQANTWLLAGITTIADWLGSDSDVFTYQQLQQPPQCLQQYFEQTAKPQARKMLKQIGYHQQVKINPYTCIKDLCSFIDEPTPLQTYSANVNISKGPQLFLLEDITGAGKTEAALILAQRLMSEGQGKGIYIALPTMATSNAMFKRMADVYLGLFTSDKKPSLALAHGARHLSDKFSEMVQLSAQKQDVHYSQDEQSASAWCNYWYVDNRKKSLMADVGVGTVDQALLATLPSKHQSLRLLGLASKVLIIDEIHSYAAFESKLIENLIYFHASLGGSTILLSATMPYDLRRKMVNAYYNATGQGHGVIETDASFPWVTHCSSQDLQEKSIDPRPAVARSVAVKYNTDEQALWELVEQSLKQGKSVVWIKNTVNDTIECFHQAMQKFADIAQGITLFHSRFCMSDRIKTEEKVLKIFGKKSTSEHRRGQLLISSPILDQSLDVDISVMITDIAPIDVLIQRLGRCCRHLRDADEIIIENPTDKTKDGRGKATLHLHGPAYTKEPAKDWLAKDFAGTQAVYRDPSIIWRTAKILDELKAIEMPGKARKLIEAVYSPEQKLNVPQALERKNQEHEGAQQANQYMAQLNSLDFAKGYTECAATNQWSDETRIPTRLAEDGSDFILLIAQGDELRFYFETDRYPLDMNKISLYNYYLTECEPSIVKQYQPALDALSEQHPAFKYAKPLIFTEQDNGELVSCGVITTLDESDNIKEIKQVELRYDAKMGLRKLDL